MFWTKALSGRVYDLGNIWPPRASHCHSNNNFVLRQVYLERKRNPAQETSKFTASFRHISKSFCAYNKLIKDQLQVWNSETWSFHHWLAHKRCSRGKTLHWDTKHKWPRDRDEPLKSFFWVKFPRYRRKFRDNRAYCSLVFPQITPFNLLYFSASDTLIQYQPWHIYVGCNMYIVQLSACNICLFFSQFFCFVIIPIWTARLKAKFRNGY